MKTEMAALPQTILQFSPFQSAPESTFFAELGRRKLHTYGLSDAAIDIIGSFARAERAETTSPLCVGADAFGSDASGVPPSLCAIPGTLHNANTLEDFKEFDKTALLETAAQRIWDDISSGAALAEPERLLRFLVLTFADLKTHRYYYWFAFPAFAISPPPEASEPIAITSVLDGAQLSALRQGFAALSPRAPPFFAVRLTQGGVVEVDALLRFAEWRAAEASEGGEALLAFCDPCPLLTNPGWPLRNLLAFVGAMMPKFGLKDEAVSVRVLCFREPPPGASMSLTNASAAASLELSQELGGSQNARSIVLRVTLPARHEAPSQSGAPPPPKSVGWERNSVGKLGARLMDLSAQMKPETLAEASVDLNLRLMRWRLMPSLQTEKVAGTRCLLMGAGTLGCAVARCLLGWGVRTITFVDSGVVSYSNPVRQTLFTFDDCVSGATPKAQAAADALRRIFPSVEATAHRIAIPMPGHSVGPEVAQSVKADCQALSKLVEDHDVVFLLTDTRESRWLPSLLAAVHGKLVINAALGFDSLLVMRHGVPKQGQSGGAGTSRLGCYFCNDVVAPANSMLRRTLDQQCTVSRPGLSMIASALAVELMVTLLHHPKVGDADADIGAGSASAVTASPLGCVPHQIRASLPMYRNDVMIGQAFDKCTACSSTVLDAFRERGFSFLHEAFNRATYLEDLTGLTQMHAETEAALEDISLLDDDAEDD